MRTKDLNMLIKAISLALSFLLGRSTHAGPHPFLNAATVGSMRKALGLASGVLAGLVIFLGGVFTVLTDMILATRGAGQLAFSEASLVGFSLIFISALVEWAFLSRRNWEPLVLPAEPIDPPKIQPIAEALADLIREFTLERKISRDQMNEQTSTTSATASPAYN